MTCHFCFDRPMVMATGNNGELINVSCPVCGLTQPSAAGTVAGNEKADPDPPENAIVGLETEYR